MPATIPIDRRGGREVVRSRAWLRARRPEPPHAEDFSYLARPNALLILQESWVQNPVDVYTVPAGERLLRVSGKTTHVALGRPILEETFRQLADEWRRDTEYMSSLEDICMHRAYQRIIGLGPLVVPLILRELASSPDHWFWALSAITGEDPAPANATIEQAAHAWVEWGRSRGFLT